MDHDDRCAAAAEHAGREVGRCPNRGRCACGIYYCGHPDGRWYAAYQLALAFPLSTDLLLDDSEPVPAHKPHVKTIPSPPKLK